MTLPARRNTRGLLAALLVVLVALVSISDTASARPRSRHRARTGCGAIPACSGLSGAGQQAFAVLMAAQVFATEAVGAAETPAEVLALRALVEEPNALPAVEHLYRNATPAGKVYAVIAYWRVQPSAYHARREALIMTSGDTQVTTALGPNVHATTIRDVLSRHEGAHPFTPGMHRLEAFCPRCSAATSARSAPTTAPVARRSRCSRARA